MWIQCEWVITPLFERGISVTDTITCTRYQTKLAGFPAVFLCVPCFSICHKTLILYFKSCSLESKMKKVLVIWGGGYQIVYIFVSTQNTKILNCFCCSAKMADWPWLRLMPGFVIAVLPEKHFRILSAVSPTPLEYVPFGILSYLILSTLVHHHIISACKSTPTSAKQPKLAKILRSLCLKIHHRWCWQ